MTRSTAARNDGRTPQQLRPVEITRGYTRYAPGSVLISFGHTRVLCTATVEDSVPRWLKGEGKGWVTAEYAMLPSATHSRCTREAAKGKLSGRTMEIQRLIGRSLRAIIDLEALGEISIIVDCDVLQADGGTRTASITGAYLALVDALQSLQRSGELKCDPLKDSVAAVSVGILDNQVLLDVNYEEDAAAEVDMNFVVTGSGTLVEVQGTAEERPFTVEQMDAMRDAALEGCRQLNDLQQQALAC